MLNEMIQIRDLKANDLSIKETELAQLESELTSMEDKHFKAQIIEACLQDYYAELYKNHPIDRTQEEEISNTLREKQDAIKNAESKRYADIKRAESSHPYYYAQKALESDLKKADKSYIDDLKRIFGEIEIDIKRFLKKGISKTDLMDLISLMDSICASGTKVGNIPLSFQQKVYKWQQTAKEFPDDEERANNAKEEEAKQKLAANIEKQKLELTEIRKAIKASKQSCSICQDEINRQETLLIDYEQHYSDRKNAIENNASNKREEAQAAFEVECQENIIKYAKRKEEIQEQLSSLQRDIDHAEKTLEEQRKEHQRLIALYNEVQNQHQKKVTALKAIVATNRKEYKNLKEKRERLSDSYKQEKELYTQRVKAAQDEINNLRNKIQLSNTEKSSAEEAAKKTFILSFGKKRELKEEAAELDRRISEMQQTLQQLEASLLSLSKEDPDHNTTHPLKNQMKDIDSRISALEQELQSRENEMHSILEESPDQDGSHPLKSRCTELMSQINKQSISIEQFREKYTVLSAEDPEQEKEKAAIECKEQHLRIIDEIEDMASSQMEKLDSEKRKIENSIQKKKKQIEKEKKVQEELQEKLKLKEKEAREAEQDLNDFHTDYLIKKYAKKFEISTQLAQKKAAIKEVTCTIKKISKELTDLNKKIASAEKAQARQMEEDKKLQIKKAKEEEKKRKEQEERQQRILKELQDRDIEQEIIQRNDIITNRLKSYIHELIADDTHAIFDESACPLMDDGKRVITNSIVRKQYVQAEDKSVCEQYALVFVDHVGNAISETRLIERKRKSEKTKTSFELKAENGFCDDEYYLLIINFETAELLCAQKYRINISFSNDFDF